jgi:hypothetical protein
MTFNGEEIHVAETKSGQDKGAGATQAGATGTPGTSAAPAAAQNKTIGLSVRLTPVGDSDQPVVANYSAVNVSPGIAYIDFGFIEPGLLSALPRLVQEGTKLPENINCKLASRVALGFDALTNLHQQLTQVLTNLQQQATAARKQAG